MNAAAPSPSPPPDSHTATRQRVAELVDHLDHILPAQAPLLDFVHHNTLHGYQHLPFAQALTELERITGVRAYPSETTFRSWYAAQRIEQEDLDAVLSQSTDLEPDTVVLEIGATKVRRRELYRLAMVYGIEPTTREALRWMSRESGIFDRIMDDIPPGARHRLLQAIKTETAPSAGPVPAPRTFVRALWAACADKLGLAAAGLDPEAALDPIIDEVPGWSPKESVNTDRGAEQRSRMEAVLDHVGKTLSLPALIGELTGQSAIEALRPDLIRLCAAFLDEGVAAWQPPNRRDGLYAVWRESVERGLLIRPSALRPNELPADALGAIASELTRLGLSDDRWGGYLARVALELPGWAGLINWRSRHANYAANTAAPADLADFLAVRLMLDRVWSDRLCQETWAIEATLPALRRFFLSHADEFSLRRALYGGTLAEDLADAVHRLIATPEPTDRTRQQWQEIGRLHDARQGQDRATPRAPQGPHENVWRLFRLAQHLGLTATEVGTLPKMQVERLLRLLDDFTPQRRANLWLLAYERNYRQRIFLALSDNHGQGRWQRREHAPDVQIVCCMDDREESLRRHLEERNPRVETFGAAGFFGVPMYWQGLDDTRKTPLCPVVVTPTNEVHELPRADEAKRHRAHRRWHRLRTLRDDLLQHELRRNLVSSSLLIDALAPGYLLGLAAKIGAPGTFQRWARAAASTLIGPVRTTVTATAVQGESPRLGFTDAEQTNRIEAFLRNIGLIDHFAPLVVLLGHGSNSENNPHAAAYDCGACSGRHGGPNARVFAAMANRPQIRQNLAERGITIPDGTWFVGAEHDTCNDAVHWFDVEDLPPVLRPVQHAFRKELDLVCRLSARERCRRFASAPRAPDPGHALAHVGKRSADFSQIRPELGHATNAAAFVGRRAMSQGVFLDRRVFLISYDPTTDDDGSLLEGILLAVGPVGAGINLEYYFSTVAADRLGCGSKVPHNVTGFFGVMDGAFSDLRTGLPRQMTEIHEPMRLLLVVEQRPEVLTAICERQAPLRELIVNGWIVLACRHPLEGSLWLFEDGSGFVQWRRPQAQTPVCAGSADWYSGHTDPLPPALIRTDAGAAENPRHA
ncbi:DUF2309 domain-containing protein [Methylotetracoccus oryzae]|uniref:DUF2309 domain-containing protein n=1 Tax=Methylotetracoccus oryzae TaxID=1919059 RepID=UPI0011192A38|nr:DUF2309 domain-containing protein [Methylotetracoccus oryzae]